MDGGGTPRQRQRRSRRSLCRPLPPSLCAERAQQLHCLFLCDVRHSISDAAQRLTHGQQTFQLAGDFLTVSGSSFLPLSLTCGQVSI